MANSLFDRGRQAFLDAEVSWSTDNIKLVITDHTDVTPSVSASEDLADISAGTVATSGNFVGKAVTDGIADATDVPLTAVTGDAADSISIYFDTGTAGTSLLLVFIDTATGLPVTPNGGDITIAWDSGTNKIFKL